MALSISIITQDVVAATEWQSFHYTEQIGQPDDMTVEALAFGTNPLFTQPVLDLFGTPLDVYFTVVKLGTDVLFSGLARIVGTEKDYPGLMRYSLSGTGWQFRLPRCKVGVPDGINFEIIEDGTDINRLPTAVATDPNAHASPVPADVQALFAAYWGPRPIIDTTTYVTPILPPEGTADDITWSGSDLEGALNDVTAAGSAAGMWWFANDSPDVGDADIAPNLALHWGLVIIPAPGEELDDLLLGLPTAEIPTNLAPFNLSDTPDGITSIMPVSMKFTIEQTDRIFGAYVRGATGFVQDVLPSPPGWPFPYVIGEAHIGGTGWVSSHGGIFGDEYVDAPAAVTHEQRDAFGQAWIEAHENPVWTGTVVIRNVDGWHKGQALQVTDADHGFVERWFLIRAVSMSMTDPFAEDNEYTLTLGDVLSPSLGYALRNQRLAENRKPIDPVTQFVPYVGDLQPDPGGTLPVLFQAATASGKAMAVPGVNARWHLFVDGADLVDPFDTGGLFWLTDEVTVTNDLGQVKATVHAAVGSSSSDAANVWVEVIL